MVQLARVGLAWRCCPTASRFWLREAVRNVGRPPHFQPVPASPLVHELAEGCIDAAVARGRRRPHVAPRLGQVGTVAHRPRRGGGEVLRLDGPRHGGVAGTGRVGRVGGACVHRAWTLHPLDVRPGRHHHGGGGIWRSCRRSAERQGACAAVPRAVSGARPDGGRALQPRSPHRTAQ